MQKRQETCLLCTFDALLMTARLTHNIMWCRVQADVQQVLTGENEASPDARHLEHACEDLARQQQDALL